MLCVCANNNIVLDGTSVHEEDISFLNCDADYVIEDFILFRHLTINSKGFP